jgi:hypothetical protein
MADPDRVNGHVGVRCELAGSLAPDASGFVTSVKPQ